LSKDSTQASPIDPGAPAAHTLPIPDLCSRLGATTDGLTSAEAARRLAEYGPNEVRAVRRESAWALLLAQFKNVLIVLLLIATALSAALGHGIEAAAITVLVVLAVVLGFVQEHRAERAIESLRRMAAPSATAWRDGREMMVAASTIVPGDVLLLRAGDRIAGDARLLEAFALQTHEAALTGESVPVEKQAGVVLDPGLAVGDRANMVFAGTAVSSGRGRAMVVATGMGTELGGIARLLEAVESAPTPLQVYLDRLGRILAGAALLVVAAIVVLGLLRGQPLVEMVVFGIALAVAVVPEALPAVVRISLALGVQRLAKRRALMRRLTAVETLGCTTVICTDKTGTLTRDQMTVRRLFVAGQLLEVSGAGYEPVGEITHDGARVARAGPLERLLQSAVLASHAQSVHDESDGTWQVSGDPTEGALVVLAAKAGLARAELDARFPRVHEIPFDPETRRMTTLHATPEGVVAHAKGAPEVILASCTRQWTAGGPVPLDAASRTHILEAARRMAGEALRVLAVATREQATPADAEQGMTFLGLAGMSDPPRPEARAAIETCVHAGIRVVMITGDHPETAQAVARELGILKRGRVLTGAELDRMSSAGLEEEVEQIEVYARVSPEHKLRVVTALQHRGHVVAMTGDGVNDAPALRKADIGIAMGLTGTEVAREAAAMTLTDDNFASIVAAVEEGRVIFGNIRKYLVFLLSSNIGEMLLMAGATLAGLPLPLTAVQILYVNLATDGLPALALAADPPAPDVMSRKPRAARGDILTRPVVVLMLIGGLWSAAVNLALFAWELHSGRGAAQAMAMTFITLVLIQFMKAYGFRSDRLSVLARPFANRWLNAAIAWELVLLMAILYLPILQTPFGTHGMSPAEWAIIVGCSVTILPVLETAKWMERRGWFGKVSES
jgi:Ca2+-transporting ATPase